MSRRKIAVLGANAFSGQDFIDLLLDDPDNEVIGISRSPEQAAFLLRFSSRGDLGRYRFHQLDLNRDLRRLTDLLDAERPQWIVNFAAQSEVGPSWEHPDHWFQTNTVALAQLVRHLRECRYLERYLHISSPEAYGSCPDPIREGTPDNPSTPYAASKAAADMLLRVHHAQFGFPLVTVRATNVFGARQQLFKIIPRTAIYVRLGKRIPLHGGGRALKSYIHVRDVSRGELAILAGGKLGELYHLSPDAAISVRDVVAAVCSATGRAFDESVDIVGERPGQDAAYVIDSGRARRELGWKPQVSFDEGIAEVVEWVERHWAEIERQPLEYIHKP
jgi:dTDP-glucose 4,6-dehydratase